MNAHCGLGDEDLQKFSMIIRSIRLSFDRSRRPAFQDIKMEPPSSRPSVYGTPPAPPGGAAPPPNYRLYFEVLKGGVVVEEIDLCSAAHLLFGRQADVVDIELAHPSISRRHCYVQHAFVSDSAGNTGADVTERDASEAAGAAPPPSALSAV